MSTPMYLSTLPTDLTATVETNATTTATATATETAPAPGTDSTQRQAASNLLLHPSSPSQYNADRRSAIYPGCYHPLRSSSNQPHDDLGYTKPTASCGVHGGSSLPLVGSVGPGYNVNSTPSMRCRCCQRSSSRARDEDSYPTRRHNGTTLHQAG
jgi:hypothetical protein